MVADGAGNVYFANYTNSFIEGLPRAFVDPTAGTETGAAGSDSLPIALSSLGTLSPPFSLAFFGPNQNPAQASVAQLPQPQIDGSNLFISFTEPPGVSGLVYGAEWSTALGSSSCQPVTDIGSGGARLFAVPINRNSQVFMRLTVTDPSP